MTSAAPRPMFRVITGNFSSFFPSSAGKSSVVALAGLTILKQVPPVASRSPLPHLFRFLMRNQGAARPLARS